MGGAPEMVLNEHTGSNLICPDRAQDYRLDFFGLEFFFLMKCCDSCAGRRAASYEVQGGSSYFRLTIDLFSSRVLRECANSTLRFMMI